MKPPIVFKCEPSLWEMMAQVNPDGRSAKPFDMRRWDISDERICRLSWGHIHGNLVGPIHIYAALERSLNRRHQSWQPDETEVRFQNKATGEVLTFEYLGVEFPDWAPGWGFLLLGERLHPPVDES